MFGPFLDHGITMDQVRGMTMHDVAMAHRYWRRNPPLRIIVAMVAKSLGVQFPDPDKPATSEHQQGKYMTPEEVMLMMRVTGGKIEGLGQFNG